MKAREAELLAKLIQDKRVLNLNGEETEAGIAYYQTFPNAYKFN